MRLPNNIERYQSVKVSISLFIICTLFRNSPVGITINSQISETPMSRIDFMDDGVVTMNFKIESLSVSYMCNCMCSSYAYYINNFTCLAKYTKCTRILQDLAKIF